MDIFGCKQRHAETKAMFAALYNRLDAVESLIGNLTTEARGIAAAIEQSQPCCVEKHKLLIEARDSASRMLNTVARLHPVGR